MEKLLLHSNAPWAPTGYGQQVKLFAKSLAEKYDLAISAFYGLEGDRLNYEGIPVLPGLGGEYGNACLTEHAEYWFGERRGGLVLTLLDVWVLDSRMVAGMDTACWVPVDHDPAPPDVRRFFAESNAVPIAMSRFGQEQLEEFDALYVPHAVDCEIFKPYDRDLVREATGVSKDAFLIGMVAANKGRPSRKSFQEALESFRHFRERHDDAVLYLHTTIDPNFSQGEDIMAMVASLQLPEGSVLVADQYRQVFNPLSGNAMAQVYSSFDVLLNPAQGEGFGVPIMEAQACGTPAVVTDFSAMKEVCGAGWKVGCRPRWTGQRSWQATPLVEEIVEALEDCYSLGDKDRRAQAHQARLHAEGYDLPKVFEEHMLPALEQARDRIIARKPRPLQVAA